MKTEAEFNDWLKRRMRHMRKGLWSVKIAKDMGIKTCVYNAYETGDLTLTVYQLYCFMHATGCDAETVKQIFDDTWHKPAQHIKKSDVQ